MDVWELLSNGQVTIRFYAEDDAENTNSTLVGQITKFVESAAVVVPSDGGGDGGDDEETTLWYEILPWWLQAMVTGAISATVGIAIKMSYNRFKKKRDMKAMMEAPTVILQKKYEIVHHDFLTEYGKVEKQECRVGIAQIGLSYTGGEDFADEYFTSDKSHMMRLRPNLVEKVRANIKGMVEKAHENGVNILLFPEMTFDLNIDKCERMS